MENEKQILETKDMDEKQAAFVMNFINQNLMHARHVENERLTFNSIYMAMIGGILAFSFSIDIPLLSIFLIITLLVLGRIAVALTQRWDYVFDAHINAAERGYKIIKKHYLRDELIDVEKPLTGQEDVPVYPFRVKLPETGSPLYEPFTNKRTRELFMLFYRLISLVLVVALLYFIFHYVRTVGIV